MRLNDLFKILFLFNIKVNLSIGENMNSWNILNFVYFNNGKKLFFCDKMICILFFFVCFKERFDGDIKIWMWF